MALTVWIVIPAEAGIQVLRGLWTPAFAGVTKQDRFLDAL